MIFDSLEMRLFRDKYLNSPDYSVPDIVFLDRFDGYSTERTLLEELVGKADDQKQKDWIHRLVSVEHAQHVGAWFEIMLYGWLLEHFEVDVEPDILGDLPDFVIKTHEYSVAIEAKAVLRTTEELKRNKNRADIFEALQKIPKSYLIDLHYRESRGDIKIRPFIVAVDQWLSTNAHKPFEYVDNQGNRITINATPHPSCTHVMPASIETLYINPDIMKAPLKEKAAQHKNLRGENIPYVLAIYIERSILSAEEIIEAWFGRNGIVYDVESMQVVEEKCDQTGISFWRHEIRHKSVSGILVFKKFDDFDARLRFLRAWYIQNPYAANEINPSIFPVEARYMVARRDNKQFVMNWSQD